MSLDVAIRPARAGDAAALARVQVASWRDGFRGLVPDEYLDQTVDEDERRDAWRHVLENLRPAEAVVVAELDGELIGFAHTGPTDDADLRGLGYGELYAVHLLPEHRGRGAGTALLAEGRQRLLRGGFRSAALWVLGENARARAFYERDGWTIDGAARTFADAQEVRYRRTLAGSNGDGSS